MLKPVNTALLAIVAVTLFGAQSASSPKPILVPAQRVPVVQKVIVLEGVPREMVHLDQSQGWNPPVYSSAPGATRTALPYQTCQHQPDSIDFGRIRRNGFKIADYRLHGQPHPSGYARLSHGRVQGYKRDGTRLINARSPAEIDVMHIYPDTWGLDVPVHGKTQRLACTSTWSMTITVIGPLGADPYTGRRRPAR